MEKNRTHCFDKIFYFQNPIFPHEKIYRIILYKLLSFSSRISIPKCTRKNKNVFAKIKLFLVSQYAAWLKEEKIFL